MHTEAPQTAPRGPRHALRYATFIAGARLAHLVRTRGERLSRRAVIGAGLLTATVVALAYLRGADVRAGFAVGQPGMLPQLLPYVAEEDRPSGP
jgi:hypothetical protein